MFKKQILLALTFLAMHTLSAQSKHSSSSLFTSYKGLVMAGYQGWFNAADDGAGRGWNHYNKNGKFEPGAVKVDMWPDVAEYKKLYKTPFQHADGSYAYTFSSYDASTVELHFKWMKDYGIDGVFVQRFVSNVKNKRSLHHNNTVLANAMRFSQQYKRAFAVMYDFSGMRANDDTTVIKDWKMLVDSLKITRQGKKQTYLYHNHKPLVVLWGIGFPGRPYGLKEAEKIIDFLKNDPAYGGCSVMLGVPTYWRELDKDTDKDPYLHTVIKKADIVHPWFVGRYQEATYAPFKERIRADIAWCKENKLDYVPTVFPGFTWHNMYENSPMNQIPRNRGQFFWKQLSGAIGSGAEMIYIAMFDEIDEGTAIFKCSTNPPTGASNFVAIEEGLPSDYYLYLAGQAGKMLRKQIPLSTEIPAPVTKR